MIEHNISHQYQPTNYTCSQTSMSMLLSFFGRDISSEQIEEELPILKREDGSDWGTINQQIATWAISKGYDVEINTADFQVIDLGWAKLSNNEMLKRMEFTKDKRIIPSLGKNWSKVYMQSYIDFINAGGKLKIHPYFSTELLDKLLSRSPVLIMVCINVLYNMGWFKQMGLLQTEPDDVNGWPVNHTIVIYGKNNDGKYLIADPMIKPGRHEIEAERLLASMCASQIECDNLSISIKEKKA